MRILVIDGDVRTRASLEAALQVEGHEVVTAGTGVDASPLLASGAVEIVLYDVEAPAIDGLGFLAACRACEAHITVIMMGPRGNDELALQGIRAGAFDYIPKPFRTDHAVLVVRKAIDQARLRSEVQRLREELLLAMTGVRGGALPATSRITPTSSPAASLVSLDEDLSVKRRTATLERTLIRRALERTGGNRTRAARLLDLSHRALLYKIREYGLHR